MCHVLSLFSVGFWLASSSLLAVLAVLAVFCGKVSSLPVLPYCWIHFVGSKYLTGSCQCFGKEFTANHIPEII